MLFTQKLPEKKAFTVKVSCFIADTFTHTNHVTQFPPQRRSGVFFLREVSNRDPPADRQGHTEGCLRSPLELCGGPLCWDDSNDFKGSATASATPHTPSPPPPPPLNTPVDVPRMNRQSLQMLGWSQCEKTEGWACTCLALKDDMDQQTCMFLGHLVQVMKEHLSAVLQNDHSVQVPPRSLLPPPPSLSSCLTSITMTTALTLRHANKGREWGGRILIAIQALGSRSWAAP